MTTSIAHGSLPWNVTLTMTSTTDWSIVNGPSHDDTTPPIDGDVPGEMTSETQLRWADTRYAPGSSVVGALTGAWRAADSPSNRHSGASGVEMPGVG